VGVFGFSKFSEISLVYWATNLHENCPFGSRKIDPNPEQKLFGKCP
jgi:hypothetical protein